MTLLAVKDVKRSREFYKETFDFEISMDLPVGVTFRLHNGHELMLYQREGFSMNTGCETEDISPGKTTGTELYFHVDEMDDVIEKLEKLRARLLSPLAPRNWGDDVVYYADPDDNVLAIGRLTSTKEKNTS